MMKFLVTPNQVVDIVESIPSNGYVESWNIMWNRSNMHCRFSIRNERKSLVVVIVIANKCNFHRFGHIIWEPSYHEIQQNHHLQNNTRRLFPIQLPHIKIRRVVI